MTTVIGDRRTELRYRSIEKVSLHIEGMPDRLGILRNFSRRGAFISVVGAPWPPTVDRFDLVVGGRRIGCTVIDRKPDGLRCQFGKVRRPAAQTKASPPALPSPSNATEKMSGGSDPYVDGWFQGCVQIDPQPLSAAASIDALTSHLPVPERRLWVTGFLDALNHRQWGMQLPR